MSLQTIIKAVDLFFVAAFGFNSAEKAKTLRSSLQSTGMWPEPFETTRAAYINHPTRGFGFGYYLTDVVSSSKPEWLTLRSADAKKFYDYNTALMVEGPRKAGDLDCYVVWSRTDGKPLLQVAGEGNTKVFAARSGRGVVVASEVNRIRDKAERVTVHILGIEFMILDSDPNKDDVIKVTRVFKEHQWVIDPSQPFVPWIREESVKNDNVWLALINRAYQGYQSSFPPVAPEDDRQIQFYRDQYEKYHADSGCYQESTTRAESFEGQIYKNGWRKSLDEIKEAWQLAVLIKVAIFNDRDAFKSIFRTDNSPRTRFIYMLAETKVEETRRLELWGMINDFVVMLYPRHF